MKDYRVTIVAETDGKCYKCGQHCMKCDCWLAGIIDPLNLNNQPERLNPEDHFANDGKLVCDKDA